MHEIYRASYVPRFAQFMPSEPSLSDRYRSDHQNAEKTGAVAGSDIVRHTMT